MSLLEPLVSPGLLQKLLTETRAAAERVGRTVRLMEVCGTHTTAIFRAGLGALLPPNVKLLSGPGCPVCVTPPGFLDAAIALARRPGITIATFGDMIRVPGSESSLEQERATGADVRVVYSPTDALRMALDHKERDVVFLAVGFETTAPANAVTLGEAARRGIGNFFVLSAHKLIPPALRALLSDRSAALDGFILPGHVSVILGTRPYEFIAREFGKAAAVTGFEPSDILQSILMLLRQIADGRPRIENQYSRVVRPEGNPVARRRVAEYLEPCDTEWRGLGRLPGSGLTVRPQFRDHDAAVALYVEISDGREPPGCRCGEVLRGLIAPEACPLFGKTCTPATPVGACMVSSEGTCAAHFKYGRR